jgi:hypothetical protein
VSLSLEPACMEDVIEAGRRYARGAGIASPSDIEIRALIESVIRRKHVLAGVAEGVLMRDEAIHLLLAHFQSAWGRRPLPANLAQDFFTPDILDLVQRGLFGDP